MRHNTWALFCIFLLLGLSTSFEVVMEICPDAQDISPCECSEADMFGRIKVKCFGVQTLSDLKETLKVLFGKKNVILELNSVEFGTLPSDFFSGLHLNRLVLKNCKLNKLSEDDRPSFHGLEDLLEELIITESFIENFPERLKLGHMTNLKELDLIDNVITELKDDWFDIGPSSLHFIAIGGNGIQKIGSRAFANFTNLRYLYLYGNRFGPVRRSMFPSPAPLLKEFYLHDNALTSIPEDLFSDMPWLYSISLKKNGILRLDQRTWDSHWSRLIYLGISENPVTCDSSMDWIFHKEKGPSVLEGECYAPSEVKGVRLKDFIANKTRTE